MPPRPSNAFFRSLRAQYGYHLIAGVDEVGCGCLAGPVVSAAVILANRTPLPFLRDSKLLSPVQRETLAARIKKTALAWSVGIASAEEIDTVGIRPATLLASQRALKNLSIQPDATVSDAFSIPNLPFPCHPLIRADRQCRAVAAASIVAKAFRDALMEGVDAAYRGYGFARHKGYGTKEHVTALNHLGPCPLHRRSFEPVQFSLENKKTAA